MCPGLHLLVPMKTHLVGIRLGLDSLRLGMIMKKGTGFEVLVPAPGPFVILSKSYAILRRDTVPLKTHTHPHTHP